MQPLTLHLSLKKNLETMRTKNPLALLIGWIALAFTPNPEARAADSRPADATVQQTGAITGRISNVATRRNLQGARVEIQGQGQVAFTDAEGIYRFSPVNPGTVNLAVSYTGLNSEVIPVVVGTGAPTTRDVGLTSDIYTLSKFVVSGEREGNALAITMQRLSTGVKDPGANDHRVLRWHP